MLTLRVSVGWHFYKEGAKKLESPDGFTSAPFLRNAKGPWAESFHDMARQPHDWDRLLATPLEKIELDEKQQEEIAIWQKEHKEELSSDNPPILPHTSYVAYAEKVSEDWKNDLEDMLARSDASQEAKEEAGKKYKEYRRYLLGYLAEINEDLRKYQHELWRLDQMQNTAAASDVPYQKARISEKTNETAGMVAPWVYEIQSLELAFHNEVGQILGSAEEPITVSPRTDQLSTIDKIVPYWHLIVGGGLILGLFSRLCGAGAAVFLAAVIATQPPWVAGAAETYYQVVELCGCLVLATIPTGRFAGLDFFVHSFFSRCCTKS